MDHNLCIEVVSIPQMLSELGPLPFYLHRFVGIDQSKSTLSVMKDQINEELLGIFFWELSTYLGHAPKIFHQYRSICMNFATFSDLTTLSVLLSWTESTKLLRGKVFLTDSRSVSIRALTV